MKYKAYIFDIDGTILWGGAKAPALRLQQAINALQRDGALIVIATGRALFSAKAVLGDIKPDYIISTNGALVTDAKDKTLFAQYMTSMEMYALVDFCDNYELPLSFTFSDGYYIYTETERYIAQYGDNAECTEYMHDGEERVRHLIDMPYGACVRAPNGRAQQFSTQYAHLGLRLVSFGNEGYYDVFSCGIDKAVALGRLLDIMALSKADTAAFGDGGNDVELLRECAHGVAVGTPCPALAEAADIIIAPSELAAYLMQL